jgi:hypothetical protein
MSLRFIAWDFLCSVVLVALAVVVVRAQAQAQSSSSSSSSSSSPRSTPSRPIDKSRSAPDSRLDAGTVSNGVYRNPSLGFSCKIPAGWVLRTEEMNEPTDEAASTKEGRDRLDRTAPSAPLRAGEGGCQHAGGCGRVLLAAFSRPPEARGEDVNLSILIAAESAAEYPGLKDAAQYFGPVSEVAKARGFEIDEEPYEFGLGTKTVVRGDFEKDVGTRVMRQSTLVMLARGYVVSFSFIGGTEGELEELVQGLSFGASKSPAR